MDDNALPLEGLYLHLLQAGFPVSARDYEEALAALRGGHGLGRRERLLWLATSLWARGEDEASRLEALFRRFPRPNDDEVQSLIGAQRDADAPPPPPPDKPVMDADTVATDEGPIPLLEFDPADVGQGGLPSLLHGRPVARRYVFEPRPLVSQREMTIAWRRLRRAQRSGPRTELDLDATVAERCRRGWLLEPVWVPARRNQARLVVLVDVSASMLPWRRMNTLIAASLHAGQLAHSRLLYFDNDPREGLFETEMRTGRRAFDAVLRSETGAAVLVVGDAGATRGHLDRDRIAGTREFLRIVRGSWPQLAWLNPMPRRRWAASSADRISRDPACAMFEFGDDGLTRAVDRLRL